MQLVYLQVVDSPSRTPSHDSETKTQQTEIR